jgi:mono/diheme cytochrome c family protein
MPPEQIYFMVCAACHEPDGRGNIARKTMKDAETIPDLTDAKWQASRTDAELEHSILEGKGKIMLARKDILSLAHTDVKDMVALMRRFRDGKQVITGVPTGPAPAAAPGPVAAGPEPINPAPPPLAPAMPAAPPSPFAAGPTATGASPPVTTPAPPAISAARPAPPALAPGAATAPAGPAQPVTEPAFPLPAALPIAATAPSPERAAQLQAAAEFYRTNCFACHGTDGTGNLIRPLMPAIPNFTSREWQMSRTDSQLQTSILEGKGTFMPPWMGKFSADFARDLIARVRSFGPPDLLAARAPTRVASGVFENKIRALRMERDEVERQLRELDRSLPKQ